MILNVVSLATLLCFTRLLSQVHQRYRYETHTPAAHCSQLKSECKELNTTIKFCVWPSVILRILVNVFAYNYWIVINECRTNIEIVSAVCVLFDSLNVRSVFCVDLCKIKRQILMVTTDWMWAADPASKQNITCCVPPFRRCVLYMYCAVNTYFAIRVSRRPPRQWSSKNLRIMWTFGDNLSGTHCA